MVDVLTPRQRHLNMSRIRGKNTKPELLIRKRLHVLGFRYRLHVRSLPGKPDIVFRRYNAVVFVNGCFWHWHGCRLFKLPETRNEWWREKLQRNRDNDAKKRKALMDQNWRVLTIWECAYRQTGNPQAVELDRVAGLAAEWLQSDVRCADIGAFDCGVRYETRTF